MKKFLITISVLLLAVACNKQAEIQPAQNQSVQNQQSQAVTQLPKTSVESAQKKSFRLPLSLDENSRFVSFDYFSDWSLTVKDDDNIELKKEDGEIYIFNKNFPTASNIDALASNLNTYLNSIGDRTLTKDGESSVARGLEKHQFNILVNDKNQLHTIFYVGNLLVDVYTQDKDLTIYNQLVNSFKYLGY